MKKTLITISALIIPVLIAGCIATGTVVLVYDVDSFVSTDNSVNKVHIDLNSNSDYTKNKDKVKSVDAISVVGWLINNTSTADSAEIWMSDDSTYTTPAQVRANAIQIFASPSVPANDSLMIDWAEGMSHIRNFAAIESEVNGDGNFWVYGIAARTPFNMGVRASLIITITAGL